MQLRSAEKVKETRKEHGWVAATHTCKSKMQYISHHMKAKENPCIKRRKGWEPIHKKYKANKSMRTHLTKKHNNQHTTNILIK